MTNKEREALQRAYDELKDIVNNNKDSEELTEEMYVATLRAAKAIKEIIKTGNYDDMSILMNAYWVALIDGHIDFIKGVHTVASEKMTGFIAACLSLYLAECQQWVCEMVREGGLSGATWHAGDLLRQFKELFPGLSVNKG
jgi:hypothetical protein